MYTLIRAYQHDSKVKNRWVEMTDLGDLLNTNIEMINGTFGPIRLILVHNSEPDKQLAYDFVKYRKQVNPPAPATLAQWLTAAAGINLTTTEFKGLKQIRAVYADLFEAGFKIETTYPGGIPNATQTDEYRTDVLIMSPNHVSVDVVRDNCLFTVAGFLHYPYSTANGVYLKDAGTTLNRSNQNTCGVISFANLGGIRCHRITPEMLSALPEHGERNKKIRRPVYVKIEDFNPDTQTAFLSLMGVLIPLGNIFREVGEGLFEINLVRYNYILTYMRAERFLGFAAIKKRMESNPEAPTAVSHYDLASRSFLEDILTCSQSFICVINSPGVYFEKQTLETTQNSMSFLSSQPVKGPVVDDEGVFVEYLQSFDLDTYVLDTPPTDLIDRRVLKGNLYNDDAIDALPSHLGQLKRNRLHELFIARSVFGE